MNKAQTYLLGMVCQLKPDHELVRDLQYDSEVIQAFAASATKLTREDLLGKAPNGKYAFEYKEVWQNFSKILKIMEQSGDLLRPEDIVKPVMDGKSLLRMAESRNALDEIFVPAIWKGRMEAMENAWFTLSFSERNKYDFQRIRSAVAHAEGRTTREEQLEKAGITADKMRVSLRLGDLRDVKAALERHGDHLRSADLFLRDNSNDTALDSFAAWNSIDSWMPELLKHGEMPAWHEWLTSRAGNRTPLGKALEHGAAWKLFRPEYWQKNPDDMLRLYEHVPPEKRGMIQIHESLSKIMDMNFAGSVDIGALKTRASLFTPIAGREMHGVGGEVVRVMPVMLEKTWKNIDLIRENLRAAGQDLALSDLRQRVGFVDDTLLHVAVRHGQFDAVLRLAKDTQDVIALDDLLAKNARGQCVLDDLVQQGKIKNLMEPDLWVGRVRDMVAVWNVLPAAARKDIDFGAIHSRVNILSLREGLKNRQPQPGSP